jgi:hypothetical protein
MKEHWNNGLGTGISSPVGEDAQSKIGNQREATAFG